MHTILLEPNDVLFFRDGRPMSGSLAGHGAAWPHPAVINGAFHAALHRSGFDKTAHSHRRGARGLYAEDALRDRKFGSLVTAGPFPVRNRNDWYFPRPQDLTRFGLQPTLRPTRKATEENSSLPEPLKFAVASETPPDKSDSGPEWISRQAFERYLNGGNPTLAPRESAVMTDFADREHAIGIAIDPETGTTGSGNTKGMIYSSHFLRLKDDWQLGVAATAEDKDFRHPIHGSDLVLALLAGGSEKIVVGGQQRVCTASLAANQPLPLPKGLTRGFQHQADRWFVKWVLLSPAVWPAITEDPQRSIIGHTGGWLPNWIAQKDCQFDGSKVRAGEVLLLDGPGRMKAQRKRIQPGSPIPARLVAALVPKPIPVTGWALPHGETLDRQDGGAKSSHLAVPAGAIYYFEADSSAAAEKLAQTLNWHGSDSSGRTLLNRRSTLLGEKGFGIGVCGTWNLND